MRLPSVRKAVWLNLVAAVAVMAGVSVAARAQTVDPYTIEGVLVDVTAESATQARDRALMMAQDAAAKQLLARLLPEGTAVQASKDELSRLVQSFQIVDERRSSVRYIAEVTYKFSTEAVGAFLNARGYQPFDRIAPARLVLPIFSLDGNNLLWDDNNPWLQAWRRRDTQGGLVPLLAPDGDLEDIAAIDAGGALNGDAAALDKLRQRYQVTEIIVALLQMQDGKGVVALKRYVPQGAANLEPVVQPTSPDDEGAVFLALLPKVAAQVDRSWKYDSQLSSGAEQLLVVAVPIKNLADWAETSRRLASVPAVQRQNILVVEQNRRVIELSFAGGQENLAQQMRQVGLALTLSALPGEGWVLTRADGATP